MFNKPKPETVYRIKVKTAGEWRYVKDENGVPISVVTSRPQNNVPFIFRHQHPSIAAGYIPGETLIEEPDMEATKRRIEFQKQRQEEEDERIQGMWWNN